MSLSLLGGNKEYLLTYLMWFCIVFISRQDWLEKQAANFKFLSETDLSHYTLLGIN